MADTGVKYPATVSTVLETGDDNDWVTPGEVVSDNGVYGNITAASFDANDLSYLLRATNPSMGVPSGATINGILVEIERYYAAGTVADYDVNLTKDGTTRVGDDKSTAATFPTSPAITSFGGATDLWGTTWTVDEVNATTFGVLYKMQATGANADGFVDFIRITVYYTPASGTDWTKNLAESVTISDSPGKAPVKAGSDAVTAIDGFARQVDFLRSYPDTVAIADSLSKTSGVTISDLLSIADSILAERGLVKGLADSVSLADLLSVTIGLNRPDSVSIADSISNQVDLARTLLDSVSLTDSLSKLPGLIKADNITIVESAAKAIILNRIESLIVADSLSKTIGAIKSDLLAIIDDIQTQLGAGAEPTNWTKALEDLVNIVESLESLNTAHGLNFPRGIKAGPAIEGKPIVGHPATPRNTGYIMGG